ncbi:MAG: hypothetical protein JNK15_25400 [Planctomycetes bacterium]|nr:hypothetical protein [Planctomycetota bacterium]
MHSPSPRSRLVALLALFAFAQAASADEVRLHDGRVLVGSVTKKGDTLEVATRDGVVVVQSQEVKSHLDETALRQKLAERQRALPDTTWSQLQLAIEARGYGLEPELWRHLDRALAKTGSAPMSDGLQRQVRDFLARLEPELLPRPLRQAPVGKRVHKLLDGVHAATSPGKAAAIEELLVRMPDADQDLRHEARRNTAPRQRIVALASLQRRALAGNDRFVLRTAILDGSDEVRDAAIALARPTADGDDIAYMAAGLEHANAKVRMRTADALGGLGRPEALPLLVQAAPRAGTGLVPAGGGGANGDRGHIAIINQQAYIRDFDVEVAQAAFIADPKIDVLQSGSVLDVTVAGTIEIRTILVRYRQALKQLADNDPGEDPRKWPEWLARQAASAAAPAPAPTTPTGR